MKNQQAIVIALICALGASGAVAAADANATKMTSQHERCCFENPRYSGTCRVTPGSEETCEDILAYLNNPNSVGKAYCGNTKVRGGWTQVECEGSASASRRTSCRESRE